MSTKRRPKGKALPPSHGKRIDGRLARAIESSRMTPYEIAAKAGVDHRSLGRFIAGERDLMLGTASAIAEALGLDLVEKKSQARSSARPATRAVAGDPGQADEEEGATAR